MKTHTARRALTFITTLALLAATVIPAAAQRRRARVRRTTRTTTTRRTTVETVPALRYYTLGTNTTMRVRLDSELNSGTARVGDTFSSTTTEPVYGSGGVEVIPVGSHVWGRVSSVTRAGRRTPGNISVRFNSVQLPNGVRHPINGSLTTLQTDQVRSDNESTVRGRSNQKRDAVFIGGGAATGAIIGAIAGGGKGAAIGAILGGGLGTGARVYEKEKEADIKSGTEFGVSLNQSVSLPEYRGSNR
jgi:hypothetical protein